MFNLEVLKNALIVLGFVFLVFTIHSYISDYEYDKKYQKTIVEREVVSTIKFCNVDCSFCKEKIGAVK